MTVSEFVQYVKVKLNRIDTSAYQDVRPEEVQFFADDALRQLILNFDLGNYSPIHDKPAILIFLAGLVVREPSQDTLQRVVDGVGSNYIPVNPNVLKFKDVDVYVEMQKFTDEKGWVRTRPYGADDMSNVLYNPFTDSYPDKPIYRLIDGELTMEGDPSIFTCTKIKYDYLKVPVSILGTASTAQLNYPFMEELQNKTVTLILENLEARRLQSQPIVSKS